ncbi:iron ABC transporter permease [Uliginosibacterium sp. 31-16]|uniref:ABC transporter permease n=1 Tax=Uliginosibacterium sp. 31-16 TaxID=3068315 RepID=UPI00273F8097|nr:iron ABC transporter permease [Uliginosibacterium sp. 31-16]MDP5241385.1 iron ABC transporter permease [Uliginosibacterium sp. 31-16]
MPLLSSLTRLRQAFSPLTLAGVLCALVLAVPVGVVAGSVFIGGTGETWAHLAATVLPEFITNTLIMVLGVGLGVTLLGVACAWLTAMTEFPGRRFFEWALVLPMAMPAYVLAYVYTDFLQFVGPLQSWLRELFGWTRADYWFPEVRSVGGACAMFSLVLYPYVYMLARSAFLERAGSLTEAGRAAGLDPWACFWRISLPLARPAIIAGVSLALMETLADFGTVSYFAVQTFTTGIFRAWFSLGDRLAAAQLAAALLGCVALILLLEKASRGRARHSAGPRARPGRRAVLRGWTALGAMAACTGPLLAGFGLPAGLLLRMAFKDGDSQLGSRYLELVNNSVLLAGVTAICAVLLAVLLGYAARLARSRIPAALNRLVGLGYALPGSVIAVGVLIPVTRFDQWLAALIQQVSGHNPGLLLTGGIAALVYAYLVRYLTVALGTVESGLARITPSMDEAARSLGAGRGSTLARVHWPLLRGSLLTAGLLVFVDVMKELPATLVMRPFNFDTLATQAYTLASDERLSEAATASLAIVLVGLLPVILLSRRIGRAR